MKPGVTYSIPAILEGTQAAPVMPGPNPFALWTHAWFAWKEVHENYVPYHGGCSTMPRVRKINAVTFECPACGKRFPTSSSEISPELLEEIQAAYGRAKEP